MDDSYTFSSLVAFVYRELPTSEVAQMTSQINQNYELRAEYEELLAAKAHLPKALFNPSPRAIQNILRYSARVAH